MDLQRLELERVIAITVDGIERKLFTAQLRKSGDVTILVKLGNFLTKKGTHAVESEALSRIVEQHISIHKSAHLPENLINYTIRTAGGKSARTRCYTTAIKQTGNIAPLFIYRTPDLSHDKYTSRKAKNKTLTVAEYNPKPFQFIYALGVCSFNIDFSMPPDAPFSFKTFQIGEFRLIIIWCFILSPSNSTGNLYTFKTVSPDFPHANLFTKSFLDHVYRGFGKTEYVEMLHAFFVYVRDQYFDITERNLDIQKPRLIKQMRAFASVFFPVANVKDEKVLQHVTDCRHGWVP